MNLEKRWKHFAAMALIGDGVMALTVPRHDAGVWHVGPKSWQQLMSWFRKRPVLMRAVGAAEIVAGVYYVLHNDVED